MKRIAAAMVVLVMLVGLTACAKRNDPSSLIGGSMTTTTAVTEILSDGSPFSHRELIDFMNRIAHKKQFEEMTVTSRVGEESSNISYHMMYMELLGVMMLESDGVVNMIGITTNIADYPTSYTTREASLLSHALTAYPLALCEPQTDVDSLLAWYSDIFTNATVKRNNNALQIREYNTKEWRYIWMTGDTTLVVFACRPSRSNDIGDVAGWTEFFEDVTTTHSTTIATTETIRTTEERKYVFLPAETPIFSGPGTHNECVGTVDYAGEYLVDAVRRANKTAWGHLQNGRGWVCLNLDLSKTTTQLPKTTTQPPKTITQPPKTTTRTVTKPITTTWSATQTSIATQTTTVAPSTTQTSIATQATTVVPSTTQTQPELDSDVEEYKEDTE